MKTINLDFEAYNEVFSYLEILNGIRYQVSISAEYYGDGETEIDRA
jgi:hypothetical protein